MIKSNDPGQPTRPLGVTEAETARVQRFFLSLSPEVASNLILFLPEEFDGGDLRGGTPSDIRNQFPSTLTLIANQIAEVLSTLHPELTDEHSRWYARSSCMHILRDWQNKGELHVADFDEFQFIVQVFTPISKEWEERRRDNEKRALAKGRKAWKNRQAFAYAILSAFSRILYRVPDLSLVFESKEADSIIPSLVSEYALGVIDEEDEGVS